MPTSTRRRPPLPAVCAALVVVAAACSNPSVRERHRRPRPDGLIALVAGRRQDDPRRLGRRRRRADPDQAAEGRRRLDRDRAAGCPGRGPRRRHDGHERPGPSRQAARLAERRRQGPGRTSPRPALPISRPGTPRAAASRCSPGDLLRATTSVSCSSTRPNRPPSRSTLDRAGRRRAAGLDRRRSRWSSSPATRGSPLATIVDTDDGRADRGPERRPAPRHVGRRQAGRDDGRPGCPDRDPRHGRLARRRRLIDRLDRAADGLRRPPSRFALDTTGQRLAVAWAAEDGSVTLAIHDGRSAGAA